MVQDDDTQLAYLAYSSENNKTMHICNLTLDYRDVTSYYSRLFIDKQREAPCFFKFGDCFMLATSGCSGWDPNKLEIFWSRYAMECCIPLHLYALFFYVYLYVFFIAFAGMLICATSLFCHSVCRQNPVVQEASCDSMACSGVPCLHVLAKAWTHEPGSSLHYSPC